MSIFVALSQSGQQPIWSSFAALQNQIFISCSSINAILRVIQPQQVDCSESKALAASSTCHGQGKFLHGHMVFTCTAFVETNVKNGIGVFLQATSVAVVLAFVLSVGRTNQSQMSPSWVGG